jgi:hypothetical protein
VRGRVAVIPEEADVRARYCGCRGDRQSREGAAGTYLR